MIFSCASGNVQMYRISIIVYQFAHDQPLHARCLSEVPADLLEEYTQCCAIYAPVD